MALYDQGSCPDDGVPDMTAISDIDENGINRNLQVRYDKDLIYTYTGTILVAVNPYKELDIYTSEQVFKYHGKKIRSLDPHVFAIAEAAYKSLQDGEINQSCVISGESGAGKTESTKFILQYLCSVTSNVSTWVEQQILEANTILEAFGNAKTVRNDNSSRFGKFMQVCFDSKWMIKGCIIQDYLLEQSRITFQSPEERNYHVFYQLVAGGQTNKDLAEQFLLKPANSYQYLCQSGCTKIEGISDARKFDALRLAFNVLHIPQEMIEGIYSVISSVLWLGNLKFEDIDGEKCRLQEEDKVILDTISKLLGLNAEDVKQVVLLRQITVRGNVTEIPLRIQEARENRHAMAKALYSRTFAWLVNHINKCTNPGKDSTRFLGVLDIFGFENFNVNSFEQLCINYTNEKLHKFFNHYVFALEQETYEQEQIQFSHIEFTDNSECLELIEKPPKCILKLLTEECRMPKGSDSSYLTKLHQEFEYFPHYIKGGDRRKWETEFSIKHYAGSVTYNIKGFVDKNRDTQQDLFLDFMSRSENTFVKELSQFQDLLGSTLSRMSSEKRHSMTGSDKRASITSTGSTGAGTVSKSTSKGKPTVGDAFRYQLQALVDVLQSTNPWYVRCIKPNMSKQANHYDTSLVLDQLKYLGMCDIIRIRKEGFPIHLTFSEFMQRYNCIIRKNKFKIQSEPKETIRLFLKSLNSPIKEWQIGQTKVFLRTKVHEPLEDQRNTIITTALLRIQKVWRGYCARKKYVTIREAVLCIQRLLRGKRQRLEFLRKRRATIVLQAYLRGMFAREVASAMKEMKRMEEEMKRELQEQEAAARKEAEEKEIEDAECLVKENISALSSLVEEGDRSSVAHRQSRVDLDNLFSFLAHSKTDKLKTSVLDEITTQMDDLASNFEDELNTLKLNSGAKTGASDIASPCKVTRAPPQPMLPIPPPPPIDFQDVKKKKKRVQISDNYEEIDIDVIDDLPPPPSPPALPAPTGFFDDLDDLSPVGHVDLRPVVGNGEQNIYEEIIRRTPICPKGASSQFSKLANIERLKLESQLPRSPSPQRRRNDSESSGHLVSPEVVPVPSGPRATNGQSAAHGWRHNQAEGDDPVREARKRTRVERRIHEIEVTEDHRGMEAVYHDIIEFAEQNFNNHDRVPEGTIIGTLRRKSTSTAESIPKYEMVTFTRNPCIQTSHIHLYDPDNVSLAINIFRDLCKIIREDSKPDLEISTIQSMISHGIEREELRDEIYIQCMRQATNNPSVESLEKVWLVICLCVVAFHPSKGLYKYFISFLHKNSHYDGKLKQYVQWCSANCKVTKVSCRKMPPSSVEIAAMKRLGTVVCRFFFMDGSTKTIDIHPCDTAGDAMQKIAEKKGLQSLDGWSIYECGTEGEKHVKAHDYLYDVIASWEINQSTSVRLSSGIYGTITKGTIHTKAIGAGDNKFIFRKRLFKNIKELSNDPVEINLLYAQAVYSVVKRDDFPITEKDALKLAGLQAQVLHGEPKNKMENYASVDSYLPQRISQTRPPGDWIRILAEVHAHYGANKSDLVAKVLYLSCVMQYDLYGAALYPVKYRGYWSYGNSMILGICSDRIKLVKVDDKFVLHEYKYCDIESIFIDPSDDFITINLPKTMTDAQRCFVFEARDKVEIGSLIASYSPIMAGWMKEMDGPTRKVRLTIEDRHRLYTNVVMSRRQLVDNDLVKKPSSDSGFFRSTLRRINRASSKWRNDSGADEWGETYKGFPHSYWAFSRHYLTDTLTGIADSDVGNGALEIFGLILSYSGLNDERENSTYVNEADHISLAQNIMERSMQKDVLLNELYLQLIKQTTDHPKPNSRINLRHWALLSLACSVILPPHKLIRKYLIAHLKKCASDYISEEGKVARFADKCLHKLIGSGRRQWPPSRQEIICTINRRPIYARFHFMDGQFHSIEFDSSATTGDVLKLIQGKIGLKDTARGYALYEVFGSHERSLLPAEKLADVLSKWERYRTSTTSRGQKKQHILLFKKHLFTDDTIDLSDPIEKELLFHQMLNCLKNDFFPVTSMEAAMLCALSAQIMMGDYCTEGVDYEAITQHYLPERTVNFVHSEDIATHHQAMIGMDPMEAKQAFLNIIQSWPLHRATIFDVSQSFTSNWPKALWLAVDQVGIHLLEQRSKCVLCSYDYQDIINYSPSINSLMIITGSVKKQSKVILNTNQAFQIGSLIKDYTEVLRPNIEEMRRKTDSDLDGAKKRGARPMSILETPLPEIPKNTFV